MMPRHKRHTVRDAPRRWTGAIIAALLWAASGTAHAQLAGQKPEGLKDIGIDEQLGAALPLDATFTDSQGKTVRLGDYFTGDRPVVITLVYYECPMMCTLALNGLVGAINDLGWYPGKKLDIVTVSFNAREDATTARVKKQNYLNALDANSAAAKHWAFLTGDPPYIDKLTRATGFKYRWEEATQQYAHASALIICTPDGRISRYLHGIDYDRTSLRLALVEASDGKVGSVVDRLAVTFCYSYDPTTGKYSPEAMKIMKTGGALTLGVLAVGLGALWLYGRRHKASEVAEG